MRSFKKILIISLLLLALTSCVRKILYNTLCPDVIEYSKEYQNNLSNELKSLDNTKYYFIPNTIIDYFNLRQNIKISKGE